MNYTLRKIAYVHIFYKFLIYRILIIDYVNALLNYGLNYMGAVLIEDPKWCGKTTTA